MSCRKCVLPTILFFQNCYLGLNHKLCHVSQLVYFRKAKVCDRAAAASLIIPAGLIRTHTLWPDLAKAHRPSFEILLHVQKVPKDQIHHNKNKVNLSLSCKHTTHTICLYDIFMNWLVCMLCVECIPQEKGKALTMFYVFVDFRH